MVVTQQKLVSEKGCVFQSDSGDTLDCLSTNIVIIHHVDVIPNDDVI